MLGMCGCPRNVGTALRGVTSSTIQADIKCSWEPELNSYHSRPGLQPGMFSLSRSEFSKGVLSAFRLAQRSQRPQLRRPLHTGESSERAASGYNAKKSSWSSPTILLLGFIPIFTFALGTWQLQRLQWKINLIDELEEKLQRDPILLPKRIKCEVISSRTTVL